MSEVDERLIVMLEARISDFEKRMAQAERRGTKTYNGLSKGSRSATRAMEADMSRATVQINQSLASITSGVGKFAAAFGVGFVAGGAVAALEGTARAARETVRAIAEIGDEAKRAGVSAEAFQEWRYVAEQNRIGIDALTDGFKEMSLRADEFIQTGAGPAAEAFGRLGLSATEVAAQLKDPSAMMLELIGRLEGLDKAAQIRIADELFGGTGGERFVELLSQGEAGIRGQIDRARELGVVMDTDMIQKAQELDAKFNEVTTSLRNMWQVGVVGAAEFFGLIEDKAEAAAEKLTYTYDAAGRDIVSAVRAIGDEIPYLVEIGAEEIAIGLNDIVAEMESLSGQFDRGEIGAGEFKAGMDAALTSAGVLLAEAQKIDGVDVSNAVGAVGRLAGALEMAFYAARAVVDEMAAMGAEGPQFPGKQADDMGVGEPTSGNAPRRSVRPRPAPPLLGEPDNGGSSGGGGRGGSSRIDALLADLQTEREIISEWYDESLDLLNSATDAQLEAVGGRHEALERLEREHNDRLRAIRDESNTGALDNAEAFFGAMATLTAAGGDKMVKAARVFGAAEAMINTYRAQSQVLADPKLGFWAKLPAVAAIGAAGLRMVSAIKGGGGGGVAVPAASSTSGGLASTATEQEPMRVRIQGIDRNAIFTGQALIDLVDGVQKEFGNRGIILGYAQ